MFALPGEELRAAIRETDLHCTRVYGKAFALLTEEQQDDLLHGLEDDEIALESVSAKLFFGLLLKNTEEGFLSDPIHGGNRDKIGWKLIGFPGVAASDYNDYIAKYNVPYEVEPVSILDIQQKKVPVDAQGYPKHAKLERKGVADAD